MLNEQTKSKMLAMKLNGMAEAYEQQNRETRSGELSFDERLALLIEQQWLWKEDRSLRTRLAYAHLKTPACLEDIDFREPRGLKRAVIDQLAGCDWVKFHQNVLISGPTGTGKTFLACALAQRACREGYRVAYYYGPKFFRDLGLAQADGSLAKVFKKIGKAQVLVVDDWGLAKMEEPRCRDFLEILDDRQGKGATLMTSQVPVSDWHTAMPDPTVADAILDRLVHNAHRIELKGESMRKRKAKGV